MPRCFKLATNYFFFFAAVFFAAGFLAAVFLAAVLAFFTAIVLTPFTEVGCNVGLQHTHASRLFRLARQIFFHGARDFLHACDVHLIIHFSILKFIKK